VHGSALEQDSRRAVVSCLFHVAHPDVFMYEQSSLTFFFSRMQQIIECDHPAAQHLVSTLDGVAVTENQTLYLEGTYQASQEAR
jgi:hypothetical protein